MHDTYIGRPVAGELLGAGVCGAVEVTVFLTVFVGPGTVTVFAWPETVTVFAGPATVVVGPDTVETTV